MAAWRRPVEAFVKWWSRRPSDARWRQVGVAALVLILVIIAWAIWRTVALTVLLLAPVAVGIIVLGLLGPNAREWLIEHMIPIGALLLSGWLLGAFGLWLLVNAVWAGQTPPAAGDYTPLTVDGASLTAAAAYPGVALVDAADNELTLSFSADEAIPLPRQVVTATVTLPDMLAFATAGGPSTRDFLVPLTAAQPGSRRIGIVNSGVYGGWRGREATITVRLCAPGGACAARDLALTVRPEGRHGYAIRRFVNSTIDQSSPIILLLLFVVPGLAVWGQRVLNEQQAAIQKRRADECDRIIKRFRSHLRTEELGRATDDLKKLDKMRYREFRVEEREFANELNRLAVWRYPPPEDSADFNRGKWPDTDVVSRFYEHPDWGHELVAAAILAYRQLNDPALEDYYQQLGGGYDFHRQLAPELQKFHDKVWAAAMRTALADDDPLKAEREKTDRARPEELLRRRPVLHRVGLSAYTTDERRLVAPFAYGDASQTEECRFLRDGQAFWGNHPLLRQLRRGDHSVVVDGVSGSGRTALAQMLPLEYVNDPADLFVQVEAGVERLKIVEQVAEQLWRFIRLQPLFLGRPQEREKQKLAGFLATWLDSDRLNVGLSRTLEGLNRDQTLRENRLGARELGQFQSLLPSSPAPRPPLAGDDWFHVFLEPAHILGFANVVFIIILRSPAHLAWLEKLGVLKTLYDRGIHVWLFVDDDDNKFRENIPIVLHETPGVAYDLRLAWEEKHLSAFRAMLNWRYEKYLDAAPNLVPRRERRRALANCFDRREADLSRLIAASKANGEYNPRRFMALWRVAVGDKRVDEKITTADIDRALSGGGDT